MYVDKRCVFFFEAAIFCCRLGSWRTRKKGNKSSSCFLCLSRSRARKSMADDNAEDVLVDYEEDEEQAVLDAPEGAKASEAPKK